MSGVWAPFCISLIFLRATFADPLACNGSERTFSLSSTDGTLVSPGYDLGQPYPDDLLCNWVILRKLRHAVVVEFESFDLGQNGACLGDSLSFETTDTYTYPKLIKRLCGQHLPRRLYFPIGYNVRIRFQSDFVGLNYGFKAHWHYSDGPPCPAGQVLCRNRKCVMENVTCNGIDDCGDASDETMYCNIVDIPIQETTDCGRQVIQPRLDHIFKVVGGQAAVRGSWPWMVSMQRDAVEPSGHFCGGALISSQYVISAAHCTLNMEGKDSVRLVFGKHFYYEDETEIVRYVKDYKIFSQNPAEDKPFHLLADISTDIMILKLSAPVPFSNYVQPICMADPADRLDPGTVCYSAGWGQTRGTGNHALKQIRQVVAADCVQGVYSELFNNETMLCTGPAGHGHQLCSGDSGGPLMCSRDGQWNLHGVVSRNSQMNNHENICGDRTGIMIFARTAHFRNWIDEMINTFDRV